MSEAVKNEGFSLKEAFSKVNHIRHIMMDVAMFTAAVGALVATGGAIGVFDPVSIFLGMHIPDISNIMAIGEYVGVAFENASNGFWVTQNAFMDPHALHAGHAALAGGVAAGAPEAARSALGLE